jgi:protein SCO1
MHGAQAQNDDIAVLNIFPNIDDKPSRLFAETLIGLLLIITTALASTYYVAEGYQAWTAEDARRQRALSGKIILPATPLLDLANKPFNPWHDINDVSLKPHITLTTFIYTRCPTVCMVLGTEFQQLQRAIKNDVTLRDDLTLLSISFDFASDGQKQLEDYAARYRADDSQWRITRVADQTSLSALLRVAGVKVIADGVGGFTHNDAIHVVNERGVVLAIFNYDDYLAALAYARAALLAASPRATNYREVDSHVDA